MLTDMYGVRLMQPMNLLITAQFINVKISLLSTKEVITNKLILLFKGIHTITHQLQLSKNLAPKSEWTSLIESHRTTKAIKDVSAIITYIH